MTVKSRTVSIGNAVEMSHEVLAKLADLGLQILITTPCGSKVICIQVLDPTAFHDNARFNGICWEGSIDLAEQPLRIREAE